LEGADIQGVPHTFFFLTPYQFAAAVAFEAAEDRDTFLIPALLCQMGNVQDLLKVYKKGPLHFCEMVLRKNVQFSQNSPFSIYTWYGCSKYSA